MLDQALKSALSKSSRVGDGHDATKRKETALKTIEKARNDTLKLVREIFQEIPDEIVEKNSDGNIHSGQPTYIIIKFVFT